MQIRLVRRQTFPAAGYHRLLTDTKLNCLATEAHVCEQLAQGCYLTAAMSLQVAAIGLLTAPLCTS